MLHCSALSSSNTLYLHWCYFWCDGKTARTFSSISVLPQARTGNAQGLGGIPPGVSLRLSLNRCSWISSPGQKRCVPALHSNVELHRAQFHSLWSSSSGSGTIWYKIAGRPNGLCKQPHSTCNGEEREMQLLRHCSALPPGLLWFNSAAGSARVALD